MAKETAAASKPELPKADTEPPAPTPATASGGKTDSSGKQDETEGNSGKKEPTPSAPAPTGNLPMVTTKSGRTSKPSTPALATFAEAAASRAGRPSRSSEGAGPPKRSHKKGGSTAAAAQVLAARLANESTNSSSAQGDEDEAEVDENEPLYCYCNGVSYGEMVACDADDCPREWFHLECVGLKIAPKGNGELARMFFPPSLRIFISRLTIWCFNCAAKWYCDDCKERLKAGGKKVNGR